MMLSISVSSGQAPGLELEGALMQNTVLDDGFEDASLDPFTSSGSATWSIQSVQSFEGTYAARSGFIGDNQNSTISLELNLNESARIAFAMKVSSQLFDILTFTINGEEKILLSGEEPWSKFEYILPAGMSTLNWTYTKDGAGIDGDDAAYLDSVVVVTTSGQVIQIRDGSEGTGKVLTSDSEGKGVWASSSMLLNNYSLPLDLRTNLSLLGFLLDRERTGAPLLLRNYNSLGAGLIIDKSHSGIVIDSATDEGISIQNSNAGVGIYSPATLGVNVVGGLEDGVRTLNTQRDGFLAENSGRNGMRIDNAAQYGIYISNVDSTAVRVVHSQSDYMNNKWAGHFQGDFYASFMVKGGGSFFIDHPQDPENRYLSHSFVESPDMMNVYNGNAILNDKGEATIEMPSYFETLNRDFRYQLTPIGGYADLYIAEEMDNGKFRIAGGIPGLKVSWQVTGIRQDPFANMNRVKVDAEKPDHLKGKYLHPEAWAREKGVTNLPAINKSELFEKDVDARN